MQTRLSSRLLCGRIAFPIWPDSNTDATETFTIPLSGLSGTGVTLIRSAGTVTIVGGY